MWSQICSVLERITPLNRAQWACDEFHDLDQLPDEVRRSVCDSYPTNHNYSIVGDRLLPSRKLATRVAHFRQFYPAPLTSLLDLSCSKGFFLFDAASTQTCERVLGVDLCEQTLRTCRQIQPHFKDPQRIVLEQLTFPQIAARIDDFGGPFQTVLLVNTYQYLFFGSSIAPALSQDHHEIFRVIRQLCSGRVIFHNRIAFDRVQKHIRDTEDAVRLKPLYTPQAIRAAASDFFHVTETPVWGGHPVWLLDAK